MVDQVGEVKTKTDIVSLIGEYITLAKSGSNYKAVCPFHSEKTPSFMVSPELQIFKCFGCSESGDVFSFLEKFEGMEFGEALRYLAEKAGIKLEPLKGAVKTDKDKLYEINAWAARFYQYLLLTHPVGRNALDYLLKERGLKPVTLKTFMLGFAPDHPNALQKFLVSKKKYHPLDLEKAGLVSKSGGRFFDRFRGRVVFPLQDNRGNFVGLAGRILPLYEKKELAKYINSPETLVYQKRKLLYGIHLTKGEIKREKKAIVVEGEFDAISLWQAGIKNVVAIKGSAFTDEQLTILSRLTKSFILALDSDLAGNEAAKRSIAQATNMGFDISVLRIKGFKDPDEAVRKDPAVFKKALEKSIGVWDFIIRSTIEKYDPDEGGGKARISRELIPVLTSISDKIVQAHYVEVLAKLLKVPTEAVVDQVSAVSRGGKEKPIIPVLVTKKEKDRRVLLEERLLTLAFQVDRSLLDKDETSGLVVSPLTKRIMEEYKKFKSKNEKFDPSLFAHNLSPELVDGFANMVLTDIKDLPEDEVKLQKEIDLLMHELKISDIKEKLEFSRKEISSLEKEKDKKGLQKVEKEFTALSSTLADLEERGII